MDDAGLSATGKLAAALDRADLWNTLCSSQPRRQPDRTRIVIKPELSGFAAGTSTIADPLLVEGLIDILYDRGFTDVTIVGTADSSAVWAENRDLHALADLLGYRYATSKGRTYDIIDLADGQDATVFPVSSTLHGCGISRLWLDADVRIVFSACRTDEASGYALCLDTLIDVLPLVDKDLHYRRRRHPGDVAAALLDAAPVQFCLIDAIVASHGSGGRRAPAAINTGTIIAASDIVLADYAGALKMALDPTISPTFARVVRTHPLPQRYTVTGSLAAYTAWQNVGAPALEAMQMRRRAESLDRLVEPWLQQLDAELFPLRHPLDANLNAVLAQFFADHASGPWLLVLANCLLAWIGQAIESFRTMFDKDALRQQSVSLGIDLTAIQDSAFDALVAELARLEPVAAAAPQVSPELCWLEVDDAIVFRYARDLPIEFDLFVRRVDIARTIQFMNDYLGGVLVELAHDRSGRPVRQAERNIYLPQPNYLVLYQGKPIDVSKLEVVEYQAGRRRLYWKTVHSENSSATYDDGIATFTQIADGTRITITGRQQFTLPPFFHVFDLNHLPGLKAKLVSHAYQTFFDRTITNFEALVEGRDIRIGRPVDEPVTAAAERLMPLLQKIAELAMPMLGRLGGKPSQVSASGDQHIDADGFTHITPTEPTGVNSPDDWAADITRFIEGLNQAVARDLLQGLQAT